MSLILSIIGDNYEDYKLNTTHCIHRFPSMC